VVAVLTEVLKQKRFRTFFCVCTPASVSAAGRFFFSAGFFLSFLFPLAFLCSLAAHPDGLQKCAWSRFLRKGEPFFIGVSRLPQSE
ncbi:hypothetical protein, partial [Phocaeicola plebeius]|uniref:hypothetical protein n=1 Tax=Phocaeicola plebeius TaxID=310297 RepID=UPI00294393BD